MRFALVIAPPPASDSDPLSLLRARLARGGACVVYVPTSPNTPGKLAMALETASEDDSFLVYVAGKMELTETSVVLELAPGQHFPLETLGAMVRERQAKDTLFVLDVMHDDPEDDAMRAAEYVQASIDAIQAREHGYGVLVGAGGTAEREGWPFTRLVLDALDDPKARDDAGYTLTSRVYGIVKATPHLGARVPSFAYIKGGTDFVLLEASDEPTPVEPFSLGAGAGLPGAFPSPPTPVASAPPPEAPSAPATLPSAMHHISSAPPSGPSAPLSWAPPLPPRSSPSLSPPPAPPSSPGAQNGSPSTSRSAPPSGPSLQELLKAADDATKGQAWDDALTAYRKALMVAAPLDNALRAALYSRVGDVKWAQGKPREAELNFEKALAADETHRVAYDALIELATEANDYRRAVVFRRKARTALNDASQLLPIAELCETKLSDARAAIEALEEARTALPDDVTPLQRLRALYEKKRQWAKVIDVLAEEHRRTTDAKERAALRFTQADIALGRMRDEAQGLTLLEATLEDDPSHDKALQVLVTVRTRRTEWREVERVYTRLIDLCAERGLVESAWDVCKRLGFLRRDQTMDGPGAIDAFQGALRCKPSDVETRAALADLYMTKGDLDAALGELDRMGAEAPTRVATHRKAFELHKRMGRTDRAWLAATALEELGAADMDHDLHIDQFRPEVTSMMRPSAGLDEAAWTRLLRAPGKDDSVVAILRAVARAATVTRVDVLRAQKKLVSLAPHRKQQPTSTVSIVRTFVWASQLLGTPLPDLYVYEDIPGGLAAVQVETMTTAIGPAVLSGLPVRELAFVVARHLAYYRPEHYPLVFFPTLADLSNLFLAAVGIALPPSSAVAANPAVTKLRSELKKYMLPAEHEELERAVQQFDESGGRVDLASWIRGVELTATRAGFALAGDLSVAMRVVRREQRTIADVSVEDRRRDLLAYSTGASYAKLREQLGIAVDRAK